MVGLIIATATLGTLLIGTIIVGAIKIHTMDKNLTKLAECFLTYLTNPESMEIIEDIKVNSNTSGLNFPNSEGF